MRLAHPPPTDTRFRHESHHGPRPWRRADLAGGLAATALRAGAVAGRILLRPARVATAELEPEVSLATSDMSGQPS